MTSPYTLPGGPLGEHRPGPEEIPAQPTGQEGPPADPYIPPPRPGYEIPGYPPPTYPVGPPPPPPTRGRRKAILTVLGLLAVVAIVLGAIAVAGGNDDSSRNASTTATSTPAPYSSPSPSYSPYTYSSPSPSYSYTSCSTYESQVRTAVAGTPTYGDVVGAARIVVAHPSCFTSSLVYNSSRVVAAANRGEFDSIWNDPVTGSSYGDYGSYY